MKNIFERPYTGPVQAVVLDWAGTAVDHGCRGPVAVFSRAFEHFGIEPTVEEIRAPMGREKREHVRTMLDMPRISEMWAKKYGSKPEAKDVDSVFAQVLELMPVTLADYAQPVPGWLDARQKLRDAGIKVGSCTGYSRSMMTQMLPASKKAGYEPDCLVTADEVPAGRPWPWMCWQNCMRMEVFPLESVVKVGDTLADIGEGVNAGCWSVGVTRTSNAIGMTAEDLERLDPAELEAMENALAKTFYDAGAHFVIHSVAELPSLCEQISGKLAQGERP